jgi:hypothetical protein
MDTVILIIATTAGSYRDRVSDTHVENVHFIEGDRGVCLTYRVLNSFVDHLGFTILVHIFNVNRDRVFAEATTLHFHGLRHPSHRAAPEPLMMITGRACLLKAPTPASDLDILAWHYVAGALSYDSGIGIEAYRYLTYLLVAEGYYFILGSFYVVLEFGQHGEEPPQSEPCGNMLLPRSCCCGICVFGMSVLICSEVLNCSANDWYQYGQKCSLYSASFLFSSFPFLLPP